MLECRLADALGVRIFGYISFRTAMAGLFAFALTLALGRPAIAWLRRNRVGEDVTKTDSAELAEHASRSGKQGSLTSRLRNDRGSRP